MGKKWILPVLIATVISIITIGQTPVRTKPTPTPASAADTAKKVANNEKKDFKVISETKDKYGNIVRKVQYMEGSIVVTETIILPPFPKLGERKPMDPDTLNKDSMMVFVDKTNYLVALIYKRKRVRQYRAVFGPDRLKDKMHEGDRSTPEGWFKIVSKKDHAAWQKFLLINYPNDSSYVKFNARKKQGLIPSNVNIGGAVGLHGTFKSGVKMVDWGMGWTDGCVALKPEDIEDLYRYVQPGTRVYIKR
jgi:lipoprotein-anchoring transpeptidase ErfK/SrfK